MRKMKGSWSCIEFHFGACGHHGTLVCVWVWVRVWMLMWVRYTALSPRALPAGLGSWDSMTPLVVASRYTTGPPRISLNFAMNLLRVIVAALVSAQ